jgi:outer membrane protein assembly factor BamB
VGLLAVLPLAAHAAQPQFWRIEGAREFLEGETDGLSVDSEGRVRLAPASKILHDPEAPYVWCLTRDDRGAIYAGTGNDGRVYKIEGDKTAVFYDAAELEVHALAIGPDGRLYAGTAPDGKVYAIDKAGLVETFYDPSDKYIWALAFDHRGNLLVATGAEGRIHRVDSKGKGQIAFTSSETHITSLTVDAKDNLYAGSAPGGIVYRLDPSLKVFVLYDSPYREVKALDVSADGSVYAALVEGKDREEGVRPPTMLPPPPAVPAGDVTITETFSIAPFAVPSPSPTARMGEPARPGTAKGAVLRILPTGELETLWSSTDEMPHALAWAEGGVFVGTGNKGKLYRIKDERTWTMVASFPSEQLTALRRDAAGAFLLATSNPGKIYRLEGTPGTKGTFSSKPRDTDTVSSWGRLRWEAEIPTGGEIQIATRAGNTSTPDSTWTDWSPAYTRKEGDPVTSERARFLQIRAVLTGKSGASPLLDSVTTAYLQRNLRPQVQSVTIHPPGEIFQKPISVTGEIEILGLDPGEGADIRPTGALPKANPALAAITAYSRKLYQKGIQTFSWKAEDANTDALVYDVSYRLVNDTRFRPLRKSLTDAVLAWDTSTVPNGRYIIKVTAWDTPGNPAALALSGEKESDPFDVDNAPPVVSATLSERKPLRIRAVARDDTSMIRKAEYSVDGGRWQEVHPQDGINDSVEETYEIVLGELPSQAPHIVVVRATDQLGNVSTARVEIP